MARKMTSGGAGSGAAGAITTSISEESSGLVVSVSRNFSSSQWLKKELETMEDRIVNKLSLILSSCPAVRNNSVRSNPPMRKSYSSAV